MISDAIIFVSVPEPAWGVWLPCPAMRAQWGKELIHMRSVISMTQWLLYVQQNQSNGTDTPKTIPVLGSILKNKNKISIGVKYPVNLLV